VVGLDVRRLPTAGSLCALLEHTASAYAKPTNDCQHSPHMLCQPPKAVTWLKLSVHLPAQGALLLVLFQVSHTVEHQLTDRATGSLQTLFDSIPDTATLVELGTDGEPDMDKQRQLPAADVALEQTMLVKPGEQVGGRTPLSANF
jgi:hypothetical protein